MTDRIPDQRPFENNTNPSPGIKPQNKWSNSPTALKIKSFIYKIISSAAKPFNSSVSDYYHFRMSRVDTKLANINNSKKLDSIFYGHRMPGGMNIVQKHPAEKQSEIVAKKNELSAQILEEIKKIHPNAKLREKPEKELLTEGICFGIMLDLADHYVNGDKNEMKNLFSELDKGGSAEAEIYQGAIHGVNSAVPRSLALSNLYSSIEEMKSDDSDSTLSKVLPYLDRDHQAILRSIIFSLKTIDSQPPNFMESIRNNAIYPNMLFPSSQDQEDTYVADFQKSKSELQKVGLSFLMAKTFEAIKAENRSLRTEIHNGKDILNFSYVQGKMLQQLDFEFTKKMENANPKEKSFLIKKREQLVGEIKLAAASEEYIVTESITTDPLLKKILANNKIRISQDALLSLKGLSMTPVTEKMGKHMQFRDDADYLENLDKLDSGFYFLSITLKEGSHAVSFIKEADGSGYLIDPNNRKLKFSNDKEAKELINALTSTYSQPEAIVPGHPYHKLELFQIEKKIDI